MADLRAQLRRGLCALQLTLARDRSANVDRWLTELAELHGLTMTEMSCENPTNSQLPENHDFRVIANCREFEGCQKTMTSAPWVSGDSRGKNAAN